MGNSWSYVPNDTYKSTNQLIHLLVRIISRGGNFLLNIGPSPQGDWSDTAYVRLQEIGKWMKVHGEAVYNTIPLAPYGNDNIIYLQSKDKKSIYVYVLSDNDSDNVVLPSTITLTGLALNKKSRVTFLDNPSGKIKLQTVNGISVLAIPKTYFKKLFKLCSGYKN